MMPVPCASPSAETERKPPGMQPGHVASGPISAPIFSVDIGLGAGFPDRLCFVSATPRASPTNRTGNCDHVIQQISSS